jgi:hypothetical protein
MQSTRLCHRRRGRSDMLREQSTQVTNSDAEAIGEIA